MVVGPTGWTPFKRRQTALLRSHMHLARCPESYSNAWKQKIASASSDDVQKSSAGGTIASHCGTAIEGSYDEVEDPGDPLDYSSPAAQNDATVKLLLSG
jgi:hypothetical protein